MGNAGFLPKPNIPFSRAEALLFFRVKNMVDEKFVLVCYENVQRHPYYSAFILGEITHREW